MNENLPEALLNSHSPVLSKASNVAVDSIKVDLVPISRSFDVVFAVFEKVIV